MGIGLTSHMFLNFKRKAKQNKISLMISTTQITLCMDKDQDKIWKNQITYGMCVEIRENLILQNII